MSDFISKIIVGVQIVTMYLALAIDYVEKALVFAKPIVEWIKDKMDEYQPAIDDPDNPMTGDIAREEIVDAGFVKFHGSGSFVTKGWLRSIIENLHMITKAGKLGLDPYIDKEKLAVSKGYIKSEDLDRARKAMPYFQPLD